MLFGVLKPLLPKLERFLNDQELEEGEKAKILMDIVDKQILIQIIAIKQNPETKEIIVSKIIKDIKPEEL